MTNSQQSVSRPRPRWFNLSLLNLPLPGVVSILHRISGAVLFVFGLPLLLWAVQTSLADDAGFALLADFFANPVVKLALVGFLWAFLHHVFAGVRHLLLDVHRGTDLAAARRASVAVLVLSIALTLILGVRLW